MTDEQKHKIASEYATVVLHDGPGGEIMGINASLRNAYLAGLNARDEEMTALRDALEKIAGLPEAMEHYSEEEGAGLYRCAEIASEALQHTSKKEGAE